MKYTEKTGGMVYRSRLALQRPTGIVDECSKIVFCKHMNTRFLISINRGAEREAVQVTPVPSRCHVGK